MSSKQEISTSLRLGVNIDHVATVRNARGGKHPDPLKAAELAAKAGADGITAHLREDRRHIFESDIEKLVNQIQLPLNLEMAATDEMLQIALNHCPHAACIVPEKRQERTTEGGLDALGGQKKLRPFVEALSEAGIRVSLFLEPEVKQIEAAKNIGAPVIEIHTGAYCDSSGLFREKELHRIQRTAMFAYELGLEVHAGHGLGFDTVRAIAEIPVLTELNIGHFLIGDSIFCGLDRSIKRMRSIMDDARIFVKEELPT